MTTSVEKSNHHKLRRNSPYWATPFNRFFRNDFLDLWDEERVSETVPSLNIREEKNQYIVELAAPGLKKEDFNIEVDGNMLTISCENESKDGNEKDGKENNGYSRREYNYSYFSRSVTLPDHADGKAIKAKYNDGILSLDIPKKAEALKSTTQKIQVQ